MTSTACAAGIPSSSSTRSEIRVGCVSSSSQYLLLHQECLGNGMPNLSLHTDCRLMGNIPAQHRSGSLQRCTSVYLMLCYVTQSVDARHASQLVLWERPFSCVQSQDAWEISLLHWHGSLRFLPSFHLPGTHSRDLILVCTIYSLPADKKALPQ